MLGVVMTGLLAQSCSLPYYAQAVRGQVELLRKRTPIDEVLQAGDTDSELARQLTQVLQIRRFASDELGLPDNDSYRSYADLKRRYVVWNVVATEEFSVEPVRWCFLFVGCLSYRGFFKQRAAEAFAERLNQRELDTFLGGVTAYSTLGYFADPVLNTMLTRGEPYIAGLIFHELAHQRLYAKGDSAFSEAFATVVEEHGTARWLAAQGDGPALAEYQARLLRRDQFAALVSRQTERLRAIYDSGLDKPAMRQAKAEAFDVMRTEYATMRSAWGGAEDYDGWFAAALNNAHLAAVATYRQWVPYLSEQLRAAGDMERFYQSAEALAAMTADQRRSKLDSWLSAARATDLRMHAGVITSADNWSYPDTQARSAP